jgi:hypothetical protein
MAEQYIILAQVKGDPREAILKAKTTISQNWDIVTTDKELKFHWDFSDYIGLTIMAIGLAFVLAVFVALKRQTDPLKVMRSIKDVLLPGIKRK